MTPHHNIFYGFFQDVFLLLGVLLVLVMAAGGHPDSVLRPFFELAGSIAKIILTAAIQLIGLAIRSAATATLSTFSRHINRSITGGNRPH